MLQFIAGMSLPGLISVIAASAYALVTTQHGVSVQQRSDVPTIDLVADGSFDAPPDKVLAVMLDYEHARDWQKNVAECRVLKRSSNSLDVYQLLKMPVIDDRDYTLHVTWGEDDKGAWMKFTLSEAGPPSPKGVVRVPVHEGKWRLDKTAEGGTKAHYEVKMDLGGSLPASMTKKRAATNIPNFFEGLRAQLRKRNAP